MTDPESQIPPAEAAQCPACGSSIGAGASHCPACGSAVGGAHPDVDIGGWVKAGWDFFARNAAAAIGIPLVVVPVIGFFIIAYVGFVITTIAASQITHAAAALAAAGAFAGIVVLVLVLGLPALAGGVCACFLAGVRSGKLTAERLGAGFRQWWACTWIAWVLNLATWLCLPFMPLLVGILALFMVLNLWWLALFRVVDGGRGGIEALSFAASAMRGRLWAMLAFTLLALTLMSAGISAMYLGLAVTVPIGIAALAAAYDALSK